MRESAPLEPAPLECVLNISEGRDTDLIASIAAAAGADLLDVHSCALHNRSVLTLAGTAAPRAVARAAVAALDIRDHRGAHPRIGVVDVVPFIALDGATIAEAIEARQSFAAWAADELGVPCFLYGPERTLPDIRRHAFGSLAPDTGGPSPHPTGGAMAVGVRPPLVAYNLWLVDPDLDDARRIAAEIRSPSVRALGLQVGVEVQVSMNLIDPETFGPEDAWRAVAERAAIARAELVGLIPAGVLERIDPSDWERLDLATDRTIEARLAERERRLR